MLARLLVSIAFSGLITLPSLAQVAPPVNPGALNQQNMQRFSQPGFYNPNLPSKKFKPGKQEDLNIKIEKKDVDAVIQSGPSTVPPRDDRPPLVN